MPFKKNLTIIIILSFLLSSIQLANAARSRFRKKNTPTAPTVSRGVKSSVKLRSDRRGLLINFSNFSQLESGRYELIYESNGITQGAGGSIILNDTSTKEILFGSCSGTVCNYHTNISNARLSIISKLKDGTTVLKPYRIKL